MDKKNNDMKSLETEILKMHSTCFVAGEYDGTMEEIKKIHTILLETAKDTNQKACKIRIVDKEKKCFMCKLYSGDVEESLVEPIKFQSSSGEKYFSISSRNILSFLEENSNMSKEECNNYMEEVAEIWKSAGKYFAKEGIESFKRNAAIIYLQDSRQFILGGDNIYYVKTARGYLYSDNFLVLQKIISDPNVSIEKLPEKSFMVDGHIFELNDKGYLEYKNSGLAKSITSLSFEKKGQVPGLEKYISELVERTIQLKVKDGVGSYFTSQDVQKRLNSEISSVLSKNVSSVYYDFIKNSNVNRELETKARDYFEKYIKAKVQTAIDELVKESVPKVNVIYLNKKEIHRTKPEIFHKAFESVLQSVGLSEPVMLVGPAGSGKSHTCKQVADALNLNFYGITSPTSQFDLLGFKDAGGNYQMTEFIKAFKDGGVFLLDEIDNSDPSALLAINNALANGYVSTANTTFYQHKDFRMISAANTWGRGADSQYVGRVQLDAATLDRFDTIEFEYDEKMEENLYPNDVVLEFMWACRKAALEGEIPLIVSTRGIGKVYKKELCGYDPFVTLQKNVIKGLDVDSVSTLLGGIEGKCKEDNKYYKALKRVR